MIIVLVNGNELIGYIKFFASSDDNHLPIRRVMVNWGDDPVGATNQSKTGFYKNAKPLCAGSDEYNPREWEGEEWVLYGDKLGGQRLRLFAI